MDLEDAVRLKKEQGNKPCAHPLIDEETVFGSRTDDYRCISCGSRVDREEWLKKTRKMKSK